MTIQIFDYLSIYQNIRKEVLAAADDVLKSGKLILGPQTSAFEIEFAQLVGAKYCIGVTSGTVALHLAMWAIGLGPGDEVITVSNTCPPTISAIRLCGAEPVFVDVSPVDLLIDPAKVEQAITPRTRAIVSVHLWGHPTDIDSLRALAKRYNLTIIEDCAQSQGAYYQGRHTGVIGKVGCFSFYPTKNLGAYGDAGAIITNDEQLAEKIRLMRMYGYTHPNYSELEGMNARIAELQAAILRVKMKYLSAWLKRRKEIAAYYLTEIKNPHLTLPHNYSDREPAYHQFVIRCQDRDKVIAALEKNDISYGIHYPTPVHLMPPYQKYSADLPVCEKAASEILSIPVHEALTDSEVEKIIKVLQNT